MMNSSGYLKKIAAVLAAALGCGVALGQGGSLSPGVDLNADGKAELLVANSSSGTVGVLDGANQAALLTLTAPVANSGFGTAITWLPDIDNDGFTDLAVLAPWNTTATSVGTVYFYSLATGTLLSTTGAPATRNFGAVMKLVADQDSDSIPDILVEMQAAGTQTRSILISSRTGVVLTALPGTVFEMLNYVALGGKLYARSDIDGSGTVDLIDAAGFPGLVASEDPRADLNHDGVIDSADVLVMIEDSSQGIVTIAAQSFVSGSQGGPPPENCLCETPPASNNSPCDNVSVSVSFPSNIRVGVPFQLTVTGVPTGGSICAEIVQGNGAILNSTQSPMTMVVRDNQSVCVRVKYTVEVNGEICSKCTTVCMAAELICPSYSISLYCPAIGDACPVLVSANSLNTVFAIVSPEGAAVYWEIEDAAPPNNLVEWHVEYPTQLKFRTKNQAGTFKVKARYGPATGPCPAAYAECVVTVDPDSDGDGLSDNWENSHHATYPCLDPQNPDSDSDGVWDGAEIAMGTDPCNPNSTPAMIDSDLDGLTDIDEYQVYHTDPRLFDTDGDGIQDYAEVELNRLGLLALDPLRAYSLAQGNNSLPHAFDGWQASYFAAWDKDRDGLFDPWELAMGLDPTQIDQDGDGIGDGLEMRPRALMPDIWGNPRYLPARSAIYAEDGPRGGDIGEDTDWDGLTDFQEQWLGTDSYNPDSDRDGVRDGDESRLGLNPSRASSSGNAIQDGAADIDGDGLSNMDEYSHGGLLDNADTDGDGVSDGAEAGQGSMADNNEDEGRPRSELEADSNFVNVTLAASAWGADYFEYGLCAWWEPQPWTVRFSGGAATARVGPCTLTCNPPFNNWTFELKERTVFLKRGTKYKFTTHFKPERIDWEMCQVLDPPTPSRWRAGSIGGTQSAAVISAQGGIFTPSGSVEVPKNSVIYHGFASWEDEFARAGYLGGRALAPHYGTRSQVVSYDNGPNGYSVSREGPTMKMQGHLYLPKAEFYDLRDWNPTLTRLEDQTPPDTTTDPNDELGIRFVKLDRTTTDSFEGLRQIQGAITDGVSAVVCRLNPWPRIANNESLEIQPTIQGTSTNGIWGPGNSFAGNPIGKTASWPGGSNLFFNEMNWGTVSNDGVFLYIPPEHFTDAEYSEGPNLGTGETCDISFRLLTSSVGRFTLRRPPVILVHGILSDKSTWDSSVWNDTILRSVVYKADYKETSHQGYWENARKLPDIIDIALGEHRSGFVDGKRYAATQVDMVGHSQGGQLIRWYIADTLRWTPGVLGQSVSRGAGWARDPVNTTRVLNARHNGKAVENRQNKRADNYYYGDVRRFIAIGSPFDGSPLANMVAPVVCDIPDNIQDIVFAHSIAPLPLPLLDKLFPNLKTRFTYEGYKAPTAAADLQQDGWVRDESNQWVYQTSWSRQVLERPIYATGPGMATQESVPWIPFVGIGTRPPEAAPFEHTAWRMLTTIAPVHRILARNESFEMALLPTLSDLIVETSSQRNAQGAAGSHLSTLGVPFEFTAHFPMGPLMGETRNPSMPIEACRYLSFPKVYFHIGDLQR